MEGSADLPVSHVELEVKLPHIAACMVTDGRSNVCSTAQSSDPSLMFIILRAVQMACISAKPWGPAAALYTEHGSVQCKPARQVRSKANFESDSRGCERCRTSVHKGVGVLLDQ